MTSAGRMVAAVLMVAGIGLFGMLSGLLASWFVGPVGGQAGDDREALRADLRRMQDALDRLSVTQGAGGNSTRR